MNDLVSAVREFAINNYEKDGWDYLVECWSDADISEEIGKAKTVRGAISKCRQTVKLLDERRREVRAEIW